MIKRKFLLILLIITMLLMIVIPTTVRAVEGTQEEVWTDLSNAKIEIVPKSKNDSESIENATSIKYYIKISNAELNPKSEYQVYFHYKEEEITQNKISFHSHAIIKVEETEGLINSVVIDDFLQKNEDIYVSILEEKENNKNIIVNTRKIERPELMPKLGNRLNVYIRKSGTRTFFYAPNTDSKGGNIDRTLKIKIGQVTDIELLKSIKENRAQGFIKLLSYAKEIKNYNYIGTIKYIGKTTACTDIPTSEMNLTDGAYYFAYIELDDENGVYYPVEDIALYRAEGTSDLKRYSDKDFAWVFPQEDKPSTDNNQQQEEDTDIKLENTIPNTNINDENSNTPKDPTQAPGVLPKTGEKAIYLVVIVMAIVATFVYIKYRQFRDIK